MTGRGGGVDRRADTAPYRGVDRRRVALAVERDAGWAFPAAAATVLVVFAFGLVQGEAAAAPDAFDTVLLGAYLKAAGLSLGVAAGLLALHRWWVTSEAGAQALGLALLVYSLVPLALVGLLPTLVRGAQPVPLFAVRPAAMVVVAVFALRALARDQVSHHQDLLRYAAVAIAVIVLLTGLVTVAPQAGRIIQGAGSGTDGWPVGYPGAVVPMLAVVGTALIRRGHRRRRCLWSWSGLWLLALAASETLRVFGSGVGSSADLARELLIVLGLAVAAYGAGQQMLVTNGEQSRTAADLAASARSAHARMRDDQERAEERAHEARSALAAIEGATRTLEHYRDQLPADAQRSLAEAVTGEIRRLQELVTPDAQPEPTQRLQLASLLSPLMAMEQVRGTLLTVHLPAHVWVESVGNATVEIVQTLFDNARVHAPGSPLNVTAATEVGWVVLRVEDRGPGVSADEREAIFQRGVRGSSAWDVDGSGLGLYVAARLAQNVGGQLWVEDRPGGGASFALALRSAVAPDGIQDGGHVADVHDFNAARRSRSA